MTLLQKTRITNSAGTNVADVNASGELLIAGSFTLPTGASTEAKQDTQITTLNSIDTKLTSPLTVTGGLTDTQLRATPVPISGTVTTSITGVATEAKQDTEITALGTLNTSVNTLLKPSDTLTKVTTVDTITNPVAVTGTFFQATQPVSIATSVPVTGPLTDTELRATPVPVSGTLTPSGTQDVDIVANTIGLATSALQTTGNASLSSIDTKLTSPLTVQATNLDIRDLAFATDKVDVSGSSVSITGSVTTGGLTDTELRASAVPVSLTSTTITNFPATQAISATTLPLPTGAATETTVATLLTDTQLRATPVPISGTVTATPTGTQNVDITANSIGLATSANQTTEITALGTLDTSVNTLLKPADTLTAVTTVGTVSAVTAITNALPTGTNTIGNTNQTLATAEFAKITDGVDTAAVMPASTVPVVTDPGLVVSLSPNTSTVATSIAKQKDAVMGASDVGIMAMGVRNDNALTLTSASIDYSPISVDRAGKVIVVNEAPRANRNFVSLSKATTAEQTMITGVANEFHDVVSITATAGANNRLTFRYGTAGTIFATLWCANNTPNSGINYSIPIPMVAAGQPITVSMSAATATQIVVSYVINSSV